MCVCYAYASVSVCLSVCVRGVCSPGTLPLTYVHKIYNDLKIPNLDYILSEVIDQLHMTKAIITISILNSTYYICACKNTHMNSFLDLF